MIAQIRQDARIAKPTAAGTAILVLILCTGLTRKQVTYWHDNETLYRHALSVTADNAVIQGNLGSALAEQGRFAEAERCFAEALRIKSGYAEAEANLGFTMVMQGRLEEGMQRYVHALEVNPKLERAHFLLGNALFSLGKKEQAIKEYRASIAINPNWAAALNDLAWTLATDPSDALRNGVEAVTLAERACAVTRFTQPQFMGTLGAAYAEAGRFEDAVRTAEKAKALAEAVGQIDLAQRNEELIKLYQSRKPFREGAPSPP